MLSKFQDHQKGVCCNSLVTDPHTTITLITQLITT